jgi:TRAP-type C4-dicarboxylate transport system substrate-binding protein
VRKILFVLVALVLAISMVAIGCAPPAEERTTITLDFSTFWGSTDFQAATGEGNWMNTLSARVLAETTDYELAWVKTYAVSPPALWTGVKAGTYDVITSGPGYTSGVMPLWEGPEYPAPLAGRKNALIMSMAHQGLYNNFEPLRTEFLATGVVPMYFWSTGPGYFNMIQDHNVTTLADFSGPPKERIRTANPASVLTVTALNATPYSCAMSAALERFQAGLVDGILCPTDTAKGFGLGAYLRSATYAPFSYQFVFMNVMNKATYDGLPASVKTIFDTTNAKWTEYDGKLRTWGEYDGLMYSRNLWGLNVNWFECWAPADYNDWVAACYPGLIDTWIGVNTTRQYLWGNFTAQMTYYTTTEPYASWNHSWPTQPPVPTFP